MVPCRRRSERPSPARAAVLRDRPARHRPPRRRDGMPASVSGSISRRTTRVGWLPRAGRADRVGERPNAEVQGLRLRGRVASGPQCPPGRQSGRQTLAPGVRENTADPMASVKEWSRHSDLNRGPVFTNSASRSGVQPAVGRSARPVDPEAIRLGLTPARSTRSRSSPGRDATGPADGRGPATGMPAPYGSVGVSINCAVIAFIDEAPTENLTKPARHSQFPPR